MLPRQIAAALIGVVLMIGIAHAVPVTYSEAVHGDLGETSNPATGVGTFDSGVNTVQGQTRFGIAGRDFDSFRFTIPAGLTLTQISFTFATTFQVLIVEVARSEYRIIDSSPGYDELATTTIDFTVP